jgi:hypothetical protein
MNLDEFWSQKKIKKHMVHTQAATEGVVSNQIRPDNGKIII